MDGSSGTPTGAGSTVPLWLARVGALGWRLLVVVGLAAVCVWIAATIGTVTASVIVAIVTSAAVAPLVRRLRARGMGGSVAAAIGTLAVFGGILLLVAASAVALVAEGPALLAAIKDGVAELDQAAGSGRIPAELLSALVDVVDGAATWLKTNAGTLAGNVANVGTVLLFGAFTTFYLLSNDFAWWRWVTQDLDDSRRTLAAAIGEAGLGRLGSYLRTTAVLAGVEALVDFVILVVFGIPLPIPLAVFVFVAGFVPYLGGLAANLVLLLAALAALGWGGALLLLVLLIAAGALEEWFVARPLQRTSGRVSPAVTLIALPIGAYVAGLFGLIVAVPVAVTLLAIASALASRLHRAAGEDAGPGRLVPSWLDVLAAWSWRLLVGIAVVTLLVLPIVLIPTLALPLVIAAVLAATLAPVVGALVRRGWGRSLASGVATAVLALVIFGVTALAISSLAANAGDIAAGMDEGAGNANDAAGGLGGLLPGLSGQVGGGVVEAVASVTAGIATFSFIVFVGIVLTFVALRGGPQTWQRLTSFMAPWRRRELDGAADRAVSVLGGYMLGTGAVSLFGAGTQLVLMVILGIPLAVPVFVLSLLGGYIPYLGSTITTLIADLLALSTGDPFTIAVFVGFTLVFNVVQGNVVQPLVFSRAVNIHPAVALLAIPAGGAIAGILGMFLVVPFIGVVAATWRTLLEVMGGPPTAAAAEPATDPPPVPPAPGADAATASG